MNTHTTLRSALGVLILAAAPAIADSLPPLASLDSTGVLSFNSADGLSAEGSLVSAFRQPAPGERPYIYSASFGFGTLTLTPDITVITPEITIVQESCLPFIGCTPALVLPSQPLNLNPEIPLTNVGTIFEDSVRSPSIPGGDVLAFDFGTPLFGAPLNFGELVQNQFETGSTSVSVADSLGPFGATLSYDGELQPGGEEIFATYSLNLTEPGIFGEIEALALGLLNDSAADLSEIALALFLATDPCAQFGFAAGTCNAILAGLEPDSFGLTINSIGTLSGDYWLSASITPVPLPAALPLMASGLGLLGLMGWRRKRQALA